MQKRVTFDNRLLPYLLVTPQLIITIVFFIWPAGQALFQSLLREDAFGTSSEFVWFENFIRVIEDESYINSFRVTAIFSVSVTVLSLVVALLLAVMADRIVRGGTTYRTLLIWPYAVAPAVAGALWGFLFNPRIGVLAYLIDGMGIDWNYFVNGDQAMMLVVFASAWSRIGYNFVFFLAGLQAIPRSLIEAAAIDGAGPARRFWTVVFPLLSPTGFFLMVVNIVFAFFETFGVIHAVTQGGPSKATEILVYKVWSDSFRGLDLGGSAAQSVILMVIVVGLTVAQFRYIERRVHY
jgi:sn-glycerol 3-phosphate transport system permease protein